MSRILLSHLLIHRHCTGGDVSEGEFKGLLRIAAPASFAAKLPVPLAEFGKRLLLHVHIRFSDSYVDLVGEGYDCGIRVGYHLDYNLVAARSDRLPCAFT